MSNAHIHLFVKENTLYNIGQSVDQSTDHMLLKMVVYYITAAGNSISSQLDSSCQGNRSGKGRRYSPFITYKITPDGSLTTVGPAL
jgi:hypothetical protein